MVAFVTLKKMVVVVAVTTKITNYRKKSTEITEPKSQTLTDEITK